MYVVQEWVCLYRVKVCPYVYRVRGCVCMCCARMGLSVLGKSVSTYANCVYVCKCII